MTEFPLRPLSEPVAELAAQQLGGALRGLLRWQRTLEDWPRVEAAPDATPIVSLYCRGALVGCMGVAEGSPRERVLRAFLLALADSRFGGIDTTQREHLVVQVSYPIEPTPLVLDRANDEITLGRDGLALVLGERPVVLLPDVARDQSLDVEGLLRALEQKAGAERHGWPQGTLFRFRTERVLARSDAEPEGPIDDPVRAARHWLESRVQPDGRVHFGRNPLCDEDEAKGPFLFGRAAVALQALQAAHGDTHLTAVAKRWLQKEADAALSQHPSSDWPQDPAERAATLALLVRAGALTREALVPLAAASELHAQSWYGAEVVAALGPLAPDALYRSCVADLEREPWAPWTALAAHARQDRSVFDRVCATLCERVKRAGPYPGGVGSNLPEVALTALTGEVLAHGASAEVLRVRELVLGFLRQYQLDGSESGAFLSPSAVRGAFPLSPVHPFLRSDVTAHALLALL
jgi:AMMECR1 domain-containing protein